MVARSCLLSESASTAWRDSASTLHISASALWYSVTEYYSAIWLRSFCIKVVDSQLNNSMWLLLATAYSSSLGCLYMPTLCHCHPIVFIKIHCGFYRVMPCQHGICHSRVCLSQIGVLLKWLNTNIVTRQHMNSSFSDAKDLCKTQTRYNGGAKCRWGSTRYNLRNVDCRKRCQLSLVAALSH